MVISHPDHPAQRRHWPTVVNQSTTTPDVHTVQLQHATSYQQRECRSLHPSTQSVHDDTYTSTRRHITPTFTTEKLEFHRRKFPELYNKQSTTEIDCMKVVLKQNRSAYQTSSKELQFQNELGGTIHRLSEADLQQRYSHINAVQELDLVPTLTMEQVQGLRELRQLQSYQQQISGHAVKSASLKHQLYEQRCNTQQLQHDVAGVQQLPVIETPDERIMPRPPTPIETGKGKKKRMTNTKKAAGSAAVAAKA